MDSVTQFTLGAAVSAACLGYKIGPRKAALIGGLLGTLPDMDILIPFETKIDDFVFHRGWSHSFFVHILATPVIGEALMRSFKALKDQRVLVWTCVLLILTTHAIIDAMNIYGTRVFWPFYPDPVGTGSMFIIDPIFSIPLIIAVVWAFVSSQWSTRLKTAFTSAFIISTGYLLLSLVTQSYMHERGIKIFAEKGIAVEDMRTIASPFNTIVWRAIGRAEGKYHNLYMSIFDDDKNARIYTHEFDKELISCVEDDPEYQKMIWFGDGFVRLDLLKNQIVAADYRLGLTRSYVFQFAIADYENGNAVKILPLPIAPDISNAGSEFGWLGQRILGRPMVRASEQALIDQRQPSNIAGC